MVDRAQRLDALARHPVRAWNRVDELIAAKRPKDYDTAVTLLLDLQALAVREGEIFEFAEDRPPGWSRRDQDSSRAAR